MFYKFTKYPDPDNEHDTVTLTLEFQTETLDTLLDNVSDFIKGAGFNPESDTELTYTHVGVDPEYKALTEYNAELIGKIAALEKKKKRR